MEQRQASRSTTIYDIARIAGASPSTVSAVLNGTWRARRISERLADRVREVAEAEGYSPNMQASALRRDRSGIIGMIVPMYDNRYFSSIAQRFEAEARRRGYFPVVTCTLRDPELEAEAARSFLAYRVEHLVCTGATDPDRITRLCAAAGVPTVNLDLPGTEAPSVISDNRAGARDLTRRLIEKVRSTGADERPLLFVGGRQSDHNTRERVRGFREAHEEAGLAVPSDGVLTCGYAAPKAKAALGKHFAATGALPPGIFVNSTISLEGVIRWFFEAGIPMEDQPMLGCFDWDPFAAMLRKDMVMVRQDVDAMIDAVFRLIDAGGGEATIRQVPALPVELTPQAPRAAE